MGLWNFLKNIFGFLRPRVGFDAFIQRYEKLALDIVKNLFAVNGGKSFHDWKDAAWDAVKSQLQKDGTEIKGTWITILTHLAYEAVMNELAKKK